MSTRTTGKRETLAKDTSEGRALTSGEMVTPSNLCKSCKGPITPMITHLCANARLRRRRETLEGRCKERDRVGPAVLGYLPEHHIRAEYEGLARRVRKLHTSEMNSEHSWAKGYSTALNDVLAIIKELKK